MMTWGRDLTLLMRQWGVTLAPTLTLHLGVGGEALTRQLQLWGEGLTLLKRTRWGGGGDRDACAAGPSPAPPAAPAPAGAVAGCPAATPPSAIPGSGMPHVAGSFWAHLSRPAPTTNGSPVRVPRCGYGPPCCTP